MPIEELLARPDIPPDARELIRRELADRSRVETKLREASVLMAAVVEGTTDLVFVKDRLGCYLLANAALLSLLGRDRAHVLGHDDRELFPDPVAAALQRGDQQVMGSGRPADLEEVLPDAGGHDRTFLTARVPYREDGIRVAGVIGIARDLTEPTRERRQAERASKLDSLRALAAGVCRSLEEVLPDIVGSGSEALNALPADHTARRPLERIEGGCRRLRRLTEALLTYAGGAQPLLQPIDLCALVREHLSLAEMTVPDGVRLSADLGSCPAWIEADVAQVQQAFMNLVLNAARAAGPASGRVTITIDLETLDGDEESFGRFTGSSPTAGRYVVLGVRDDGPGLSEDALSRVFDPFYSTQDDGRGLGLPFVLGVVRSHRGGIRVESRPGAGTELALAFPAAEGTARG
jgi:PAS domain S-box-containing protein